MLFLTWPKLSFASSTCSDEEVGATLILGFLVETPLTVVDPIFTVTFGADEGCSVSDAPSGRSMGTSLDSGSQYVYRKNTLCR